MIAIFGASVTKQKNGYAVHLSDKLDCAVKIFGYGGMHLNNAALCFIDKIVEEKLDYCFIDWFSTNYNETNDKTVEYIDTIIYKFSKIQCKLIFLFLPFKKSDDTKKEFYTFCKSVLRRREISYIDVSQELKEYNLDIILRDEIHTTVYGSKLYSEIIYTKFEEIKNCIKIPVTFPTTKYIHINQIPVNRVFDNNIKLSGNCEIVGFLLEIGTHSGIVEIQDEKISRKLNTWDRWCYYPRQHFNLPMEITGSVQINILQEDFDTSSCSNQDIDFKKEKKKLIVHDIYFIGESLKIGNLDESYAINHISLFRKKVFGRINKNIRRILNRK